MISVLNRSDSKTKNYQKRQNRTDSNRFEPIRTEAKKIILRSSDPISMNFFLFCSSHRACQNKKKTEIIE